MFDELLEKFIAFLGEYGFDLCKTNKSELDAFLLWKHRNSEVSHLFSEIEPFKLSKNS